MPAEAKLLYLVAQTSEVRSLADLARKAGVPVRTTFTMVGLLKRHKWIRTERRGHKVVPIPLIPRSEDERRAKILLARYRVSPFKGEFLLKEFHDLTVFADDKVDNARPAFLKSPLTGENLEYDRYQPASGYAAEFNGPQHYGPTALYASKEKADLQKANDLMKVGISHKRQIRLAVFTYNDLSLAGVLAKLPEDLPRRQVDRSSKYVRALERLSAEYRDSAEKAEAEAAAKAEGEAAAALAAEKAAALGEPAKMPATRGRPASPGTLP